jgi:hypothetical protein
MEIRIRRGKLYMNFLDLAYDTNDDFKYMQEQLKAKKLKLI